MSSPKPENVRILLVEDEPNFGSILRDYLQLHDYQVDWMKDGEAGLDSFKQNTYDLCLLDVMMPKRDGFSVGREIRSLDGQVPLIYLTAKSLKEDMVEGFCIGADDYITKPFDSEVLLLKIRAILRRAAASAAATVTEALPDKMPLGKYEFDYPVRRLRHTGSQVDQSLSPREAELLRMLCEYKDKVMPRAEALQSIWGADNYFTTRSMDVFIARLRKYQKEDPTLEIINIHGQGYILKES